MSDFARTLSCQQDIAADGAFSLGMLARFEPVLRERDAAAYRELFWEAGMIGQALYLAAEAAGVRGTGIGCYFDDVLHNALGLVGHDWAAAGIAKVATATISRPSLVTQRMITSQTFV